MPDYVELHCHSNFSLLDGASHPEGLVARAAELGMERLALTDHDAVYGAASFVEAARARGIQPILGAELTLAGEQHLTLLVENQAGWGNLCTLISHARHNAPKGQAALPPEKLADHSQGLIALSGCRKGEVAGALINGDRGRALAAARRYRDLFGPDHFWIELQHHLLSDDDALVYDLVELARGLRLGYVATNNVHYAARSERQLQDVLVCIHHQTRLEESGDLLRPGSEFYLKPAWRMAPLFRHYPEALTNTHRVAERCQFELRYGLQDLPRFPTPPGLNAVTFLEGLCREAMPDRYPDPPHRVWDQFAHELAVIEQAGLANYFLIVWDIVRFAREQGIRCQGRGSAANSLVAYLLGISPIDPISHDLVFERFLSSERGIAPDIDIDFQADRREEVIQYVYRRYGPEHTGMACTLVTLRTRGALRDVGKVLGVAGGQRGWGDGEQGNRGTREQRSEVAGGQIGWRGGEAGDPKDTLLALCRDIKGFPRHLGIHNGGMVITGPPLAVRVPTEPATMPGRVVVQWDKEALERVGLVKIDLLGLRMLSAISEAVQIIYETTGERVDLERLTFDDPAVYDLIASADTIGVFQVESRAQSQVLPRLQPRCFQDLIITISLIRPGPIQGDMVHPYLRRRQALRFGSGQAVEPVSYPHPCLEPVLAETLGVILFQEQVLKVAHELAGFTPGQGEMLRRALGHKRGEEAIARLRDAFLKGAQGRGVPQTVAEEVFARLQAFGSYSFPKSHAAAFAVLVYQSAWLKCYYPAAFYVALLNNQPMGFWSPAVLVGDARRRAIRVLPVDIQRSQAKCVVVGDSIRLGLNYVKGLGAASITRLEAAKKTKAFGGLRDFCRRTRLPRRVVENLILAGAMDGWAVARRRLLWELGKLRYHEEELDLVLPDDGLELPPLSQAEAMAAEYDLLGIFSGDHVMTLYRPWLARQGILDSQGLRTVPDGRWVRVAGWVVVHQAPPTAKGHHFITLEDELGLIDIILRPQVYTRHQRILHTARLLLIDGRVQSKGGVINILAQKVAAIE